MPPSRRYLMKRTIILLAVAIAMQLNCGTIAAQTIESIGDYPTGFNKKGIYYA